MYVYRKIEARSCNHYCSGKAINITNSECVSVALGIQQRKARAPYYIVICGLSGCIIFFNISKRHNFRENIIEHKMCVLTFSIDLSEIFILRRRNERHMIKKYVGLHLQHSSFLSDFNEF